MRIKAVIESTGIPKSSLYRLMKHNQFPQGFLLSARCRGWLTIDIQNWIVNRSLGLD